MKPTRSRPPLGYWLEEKSFWTGNAHHHEKKCPRHSLCLSEGGQVICKGSYRRQVNRRWGPQPRLFQYLCGLRSVFLVTIKSPLLARTDGTEVWVIWDRALCRGEVLTFPGSFLHGSLCVWESSKICRLLHPVLPTIFHRISNWMWGQITIPTQVETHTGHGQYNSANDDVQSQHFSASLV